MKWSDLIFGWGCSTAGYGLGMPGTPGQKSAVIICGLVISALSGLMEWYEEAKSC